MSKKKISRREFLKAAVAGAAAAGLSHFRVLNFGGVVPVLADGCQDSMDPADTCNDMMVDYCNPGEDYDFCPDPNGGASSSDICLPELGEPDECGEAEYDPDLCNPPSSEEDTCEPPGDNPDTCGSQGEPDICGEGAQVPDTCNPDEGNPDVCPDSGPPNGDNDRCVVTGENNSPDECIPAVDESDLCSADTGTDFCRNPETSIVEPDTCADPDPDICYENGQNTIDICNEPDDPDTDPNVVSLASFAGQAPSTLGLAAAVLGGAALLLRDNSSDSQDQQNITA